MPIGVQLHPEDGMEPPSGPAFTGFFAMIGRVKRLEGWEGFYKGLRMWYIVLHMDEAIDTHVVPDVVLNTSFVVIAVAISYAWMLGMDGDFWG